INYEPVQTPKYKPRFDDEPRKSILWGIVSLVFSILLFLFGGGNLGFHIWRFINDHQRSEYYYSLWIVLFVLDGCTLLIACIGFMSGVLFKCAKCTKVRVVFAYSVCWDCLNHTYNFSLWLD